MNLHFTKHLHKIRRKSDQMNIQYQLVFNVLREKKNHVNQYIYVKIAIPINVWSETDSVIII